MLDAATIGSTNSAAFTFQFRHSKSSSIPHQWRIRASSAASTVDLTTLQSAIDKVPSSIQPLDFISLRILHTIDELLSITFVFFVQMQKDSNAVKEALDQLREVGWAKKWSSQPYVSRRTVSLHFKSELLLLGKSYPIPTFLPILFYFTVYTCNISDSHLLL